MSASKKKASPLLTRRLTTFFISAFFLVVTVFLTVFFLFSCRIKTVKAENFVYSAEEDIVKSAGIKIGSHSYSINKNKISEAIISKNPYISSVRIKRTSPTSITIIVTEEEPRFYFIYGEKCLVLSKSLRVLAEYQNVEDISFLNIHEIHLPVIKEASVGKKIIFENSKDGKIAFDAIETVFSSEISNDITSADLSEKFDMRFTYKDKYDIRFGSFKNIDINISMVKETIDYLENPLNGYAYAKGIIHARIPDETSFEPTGVVSQE